MEEDSPLVCLRATFWDGDTPTHRDFLGALMGAGIARETVGDICVGKGFCDFFVTSDIAPYILQNFLSAGRTHLHLEKIPKPDDAADAVAIALCHARSSTSLLRRGGFDPCSTI